MCIRDSLNISPKSQGVVSSGVLDTNQKKSIELDNTRFSLHPLAYQLIIPAIDECTNRYVEKYTPLQHMDKWGIDDEFTLMKFEGEDEGFKVWHMEHGKTPDCSKRILVWMFYLNDAQCGTEFYHHPNIESKKGRLVIWPAGWTHYHKGCLLYTSPSPRDRG